MGEILGIGATHYPPGLVPDEYKPWPLARMLHSDPRIPAHMKDPANWPEPMRLEFGDDEGIAAHKAHRARVFSAFRTIREEIDAFKPDLIVMWGDDQYENFKEDIISPFCVLAYDKLAFTPFTRLRGRPNIWGEPEDKVFNNPGHHAPESFWPAGSWRKASICPTPIGHCTRMGSVTPSPTRCSSWIWTARASTTLSSPWPSIVMAAMSFATAAAAHNIRTNRTRLRLHRDAALRWDRRRPASSKKVPGGRC